MRYARLLRDAHRCRALWHARRPPTWGAACRPRGQRSPSRGIRMQRGMARHRHRTCLAVLAHTRAQYRRRCSAWSRRLAPHPCGGGPGGGAKGVQCDLRPPDGLQPPVGEGWAMPDALPHAACTALPPPERPTPLRTKGLMPQHAAPAPLQRTSCRVVFLGLARRSRQRTLPRFQEQCSGPSSRGYLDERGSRP